MKSTLNGDVRVCTADRRRRRVCAPRRMSTPITCFDRFGATLGTIKIEDTIDIYYRLSFENGCLRVVDSYPNGKTDAVNALYLPTGEQIS